MLSFWLLLLLGPPAALIISTLRAILRNHAIARKIGLPIILVPISPENPLWMILAPYFIHWLQYLPFGSGYFSRFCHIGWEFDEKYRAHLEFGDAFLFVTPGKNWIYLCNAESVHDIILRERRHDFERPVELLVAMLDVFGPNISTVQTHDWQRQRKVTATAFTEKNNRIVWTEALEQAQQVLKFWQNTGQVQSTAIDSRTVALDVLMSAGFGKSFPFQGASARAKHGPMSYRDSLALILENAILILAMGPDFVSRIKFPAKLARVGEAITSFKTYMVRAFEDEKKVILEDHVQRENLMTALVRACVKPAVHDGDTSAEGIKRFNLSQEEVFGNMFVFNFAGHDTTAHSLAFTFYLLAAYPDIQDWMNEEICHIFKDDDRTKWNYDDSQRLNRCLAILLETLRLYNPLLSVVKGTQNNTTDLAIGEHVYPIPPNTRVIINLNALHSHPRYWGDDSLEFKPSRWILIKEGDGPAIDREYLYTPPRGAYLPWSDGNRACPGKRFAQVEHVALMASLFRDNRVEPAKLEGESDELARKRTLDCIASCGMRLLFQMLRPEDVALKWMKANE
ncbi:uncharacterized protein K452DRAFT_130448 [Aplosporella prunicola CBS 121167]|uniref:Cytochrome P450 n=1 Tax=Aplosporella prunicola CBS 121167 TaxID=1176127 RepID=A0A6A6AWR8_9PEZI|nr:uncharacterized protein K452DRAFT_130448 [Aplosporella prunicola CBS 121167]KAF2136432.1 hypothetical protein K452DRAFT_130448 [Aplosporella prunicola CBS 121167]